METIKLKTFIKRYGKILPEVRCRCLFSWNDVKELLDEQEQKWQKITSKLREDKCQCKKDD